MISTFHGTVRCAGDRCLFLKLKNGIESPPTVSILRQSRRLYGWWPLKGAFSQPLIAKATATAKTMRCKRIGLCRNKVQRAYSRNCQTSAASPAEPGGLPIGLDKSPDRKSVV